ncbi:MAG: DUF1850 domain-containing protein [Rhodospirillaceae bacterium]|nr:DUF1850 domain-containing protein [Rhodospirillaceae bacterium]
MTPALLCVAAGHFSVAMYAPRFTLSWEHSIERVEWRETWAVHTKTLSLVEARIKGTGAGMEPPDDAVLKDGWFIYVPKVKPQVRLTLPDSGYAKPMRLCLPKEKCRPLRAFLPPDAPRDMPVVLTLSRKGGCQGGASGAAR